MFYDYLDVCLPFSSLDKQLSLQLNLSVTAVYERIKKLENRNVIEKYVAIINKNKIEKLKKRVKTNAFSIMLRVVYGPF